MDAPPLRGLYAITPTALCLDPPRLLDAVAAALRGGARLVQYRDKTADHARRARSAADLARLCAGFGAALIVNDDVELARAAGAHGVHLGLEDWSLARARAHLGAGAIIGITCADDPARVDVAAAGGADYVALGAFFPSRTKTDARTATVELLRRVRARTSLPVCAIGGLTPANAGPVVAAGADLVAAVEGVFGGEDVEGAARDYARLFPPG